MSTLNISIAKGKVVLNPDMSDSIFENQSIKIHSSMVRLPKMKT